ncbi:hypothetical protein DXG01_004237 [Tephrocybe rancida]|nr:hypothetical protein DXG01_004237 [Tephrocybe rancida]
MPDFFEPNAPFSADKVPPKSEQDRRDLQDFFGGTASPPAAIKKLGDFGRILRTNGAKNVAAYGFCWGVYLSYNCARKSHSLLVGGKVTISAGGPFTPYDAVAVIHPAMLSATDADKLTIPLGIYISKDESSDEYNKIVDIIGKKSFAEKNDKKNYTNMFHGWAAARADLTNAENKKESVVSTFSHN